MLVLTVVVILVAVLSYVNGANDNSKGVATLVGFGAATPRQALLWATITTAIGAAFSFAVAGGMIEAFKAKMFVAGMPVSSAFFVAVLIGAIGWVVCATYSGLPVSTTHAIVGGLVGAGLVAYGRQQVVWAFLGRSVAVPLVLGPVVSTLLVYLVAWPVVGLTRRYRDSCVCVEEREAVGVEALDGAGAATRSSGPVMTITTGNAAVCETSGAFVAVTSSKTANAIHWASGGLVGFARGWNDAPKMAALSIVALSVAKVSNPPAIGIAVVTVAMAFGGYLSGRKVLETLAKKLTPLPLAESLTASITTAALVSAASWMSLPVSTTHVSTGAIVGAGLKNNPAAVKWAKVTEIVLSWVITLLVAGIIAAASMWGIELLAK
ncbi:MAG TPA: inorganic phosphate transporter [Tepidisphaeraceae bacterium]|jgi:PiT family inorganic phosphate transporter